MKPISKAILTLLLTLTSVAVFAQQSPTKSKIFQNFPDQIKCSETLFADAFDRKEGENITLSFPGNFSFSGKITSKIVKYKNLQSMVIISEKFSNSIFHISKQLNDDNTVTYVGRILNNDKADGYKIVKDDKGAYSLLKIDTGNMLQDCSYIK